MGMTKVLAYYLPQYHSIPENDLWWGKGFTEWDNVKRSKPLFRGHKQPFLPLNDFYYNLLDKETVKWQASLCEKYHIYGWAIYHYWYNGKLVLEQPVKNLLEWKDINIKYCFTWANHDWTNSWIGGNDVLIKQEYGDARDWEQHYRYFSSFFHDTRYIKINNKPMLVIYRPLDVPKIEEMLKLWDLLSLEDGFDGIYIVNMIWEPKEFEEKKITSTCSAITFKEFRYSQMALRADNSFENKVCRYMYNKYVKMRTSIQHEFYSYNVLCQTSFKLMHQLPPSNTYFYNVFTGWDTTPRYKEDSSIVLGATPSSFGKHFKKMLELSHTTSSDYIFIRAWNEWGQGMVLEPSQLYKYSYLEQVSKVLTKQ